MTSQFRCLFFVFCFAVSISTSGYGSAPAVSAKQLLDDAAKVGNNGGGEVVLLLEERTYDIDAQSRVTFTLHRTYRVDTQAGVEGWASVSAEWYPWYEERAVIHARVVTADGVEHVLDEKTLTEGPIDEESPNVYEDGRSLRGPLPAVAIGSVVDEEIVLKNREPMFAAGVGREIRFGSFSGPVEKTVVTVRAPQAIPLKYVTHLLPKVAVEKTVSGDMVEYRFEQAHLDMLEEADPGLPSDTPREPNLYFSTGASWAAIASAYETMVEPKARLADVDDLVKQTVKPGDSRDETVRKLLYLVHKKVRYTGVEFGEAALVPAFPGETLKRGYGDCKDKALLLTAMLRAAGIPAHLALLSSGSGEDVEPEFPAMDFNHAIVYVPGPPEMWIDATADSFRLGTIPQDDDGRLALIVDKSSTKLVRTPEAKPEDNVQYETREFTLAEDGPAAKVVETSLPRGIAEAWFRENYASTDSKKQHDTWDDYVKSTYRAEKLSAISHSDANDLAKPFELRLEAEKCGRGYTGEEQAEVAILPSAIYGRLPQYLKGQDPETKQDTKTEKPKKVRTADYVFTPFLTEWHYHVTPPIGYRVRALPESKTEMLGPAKVSYQYSAEADGSVSAVIRFDSVKGRYTPEESEAMRTAIRQFEQRDAIMIVFDNIGHALLAEGKIPEALKQYEDVAAKHPKEALHRSQVAQAFLDAGLCESARKEARFATELEPKSAKAFEELGWVLEHDLVCRRFKGAFDYDGAIAAYRKAIELDPTNVYTHVNLAILLEHGSDGLQYSTKSHLDDAIAEYKKIREMDKEVAQKWKDNLLFDLMYGRHFDELKKELASVSMDATHRAMTLVATAEVSGAPAAIQESLRLTQDEATRSSALADAAHYLLRMRSYPEAADLMSAAANGQASSAALLQQADIYRKTKRFDGSQFSDSDPRSLVFKSMLYTMSPNHESEVADSISRSSWEGQTKQEVMDEIRTDAEMSQARAQLAKLSLPVEVVIDLSLSNMQLSVDGDDATGYHMVLQAMGAKNQSMFAVKENGKYYMVGLKQATSDLGPLVLQHLEDKNLEAARKVLDWARADVQIASGDDPLAGWAFPHLWTRGDPADAEKMRNAALSMVAARKDAKKWIPEIIAARDRAKTDAERVYLEDSLTNAYVVSEDWNGVRESALRQLKVYPRSNSTLNVLGLACTQLRDWETWSRALEARLASVPDDPDVLRQKAQFYATQGKFEEALVIEKKLIDSGVGTPYDRNQYAWIAVVMHKVTPESIDQARQAVSLDKNYNLVHTLASLYAENGNSREAKQLIVEWMDDNGMYEPDSELWYVFGRIAENYQQPQAAMACYKRVEWKGKSAPNPMATYALAQQRLAGLGGSVGAVEAK